VIIGPTMPPPANSPQPPISATQPFGSLRESKIPVSQPASMNRAVMSPQAMNAPMLGITMFDRKVPNFCTWTRADGRDVGA
jgi:hypothetical protein